MNYSHYERLSALDATFLAVEDQNAHMHVGAVAVFDAAPLTGGDGSIDIERIRRLVQVGIHRVPRYQQRLAMIPFFEHPVWVDDPRFNLHYHVHHIGLPHPGDERLLKRLAGRIMSQPLDRAKPLWELWVVEGIEGNRVALITKAHHCMIDGVGSVELTGTLMRASAEMERRIDAPPRWLPRPVPTGSELLFDELWRRATEPLAMFGAARHALQHPRATFAAMGQALEGVGEALSAGLRPASPTPLNLDIGPHRRFDWLRMDLSAVKEVKHTLGGTVNDVVLTVASGALGRFLHGRGIRTADLDFRAMIPVNVRTDAQREDLGNQVAMLIARLPLDEHDPSRRLRRVIEATRTLKRSRQAQGVQTLEEISDATFATLFTAFARLSSVSRPYNVVVTNVPGPQFPTYFLGAAMQAVYPVVPLIGGQALGIALFSYNGGLFWGFNADWDAVPDLHDLVDAIGSEFALLRAASANAPVAVSTNGGRPGPRTVRRHKEAAATATQPNLA